MSKPETFMGIDAVKQRFNVTIVGGDTPWQVSLDAAGLNELSARLAAAGPVQILLEAPGVLKTELAVELSAVGHVFVAANLRQVRDFARRIG